MLFVVVALPLCAAETLPEIVRLDGIISQKEIYDNRKRSTIAKLVKSLGRAETTERKIDLYVALGDEYTLFKSDSAIFFYAKASDLAVDGGLVNKEMLINLRKARPEMIAGFYAEAHDNFQKYRKVEMPDSLKRYYYECGYRIYSFALNSTERGSVYYERYSRLSDEYRRRWIASMPSDLPMRRLYEAEQALHDKQYAQAKLIARELLSELSETHNEYAIAAAIMANLMRLQGNETECLRYFAMSAISDIYCSVKENQSMYELAMGLYDRGDIERAYRYIFASIEDAAFCNAQVRVYNASRMLPVIEASHREEVESHEKMLMSYIIIVSTLFLGLFVAVLMLVRQMRKLSLARKSLKEANSTKDEYMGQFLELCSVYMKKLDSFNKLVNRKLSLGQTDDLIKITKSAKFTEEQHRSFYQAFDLAFLKIYTTFVADVNALLRPEEQMKIEVPGTLNTELRIYALVRLGISDSTKIAEFLKYSVNTIYTYRNKMKNKAINRADFEKEIMKIGVIE